MVRFLKRRRVVRRRPLAGRRRTAVRRRPRRTFVHRRSHTGQFNVVLRYETAFNVTATNDYMKSWTWTLGNFTGDWAKFDYFRMNCIVVSFIPTFDACFSKESFSMPLNFGWIDFDDSTDPTSKDINRQNLKWWRASRRKSFKIYPRILSSQGTDTYTLNSIKRPGWMNTGAHAAPFLGLKTVFPKSSGQIRYHMIVKAYVSFRQPNFSIGSTN
ncbi:uncharacterized protein LOC119029492 [Acanthopagrus latus]|uniref:uncharacterized protein LOC119029492 n=1 Tax=Acanthopagrus latus TaxID=8177 RepID=UPI00187CF0F1|nr:uncharacterized protein LOC119029492 [Acanthopagrus latus]